MNETAANSKHPSPFQAQVNTVEKATTRSRRPEGRVFHILRDQQALIQWQCNLEKLRSKDASSQ